MDKVIVVEQGEYEDRFVRLVAASEESAVVALKAQFPEPYKVIWQRTEHGLEGDFEKVLGFAVRHIARYDFIEFDVV